MYGGNAIGKTTARKWFSHFKEGRFDISDISSTGRPSGFQDDHLNILIHNYPRQCTRELSNVMNSEYSNIVRHLHSFCKVQKSGVCVPHTLTRRVHSDRVTDFF